jgi:hypothetical protein
MDLKHFADKHRDAFIFAQDRFRGDAMGLAEHIYHELKKNWTPSNPYIQMLSEVIEGDVDGQALVKLANLILSTKVD